MEVTFPPRFTTSDHPSSVKVIYKTSLKDLLVSLLVTLVVGVATCTSLFRAFFRRV